MTELSNELPLEFKRAFQAAIQRYIDWEFGGDEPKMLFGGRMNKISEICDFVTYYDDEPMPESIFSIVERGPLRREQREMLKDYTYHSCAKCLHELISEKNARYENPP